MFQTQMQLPPSGALDDNTLAALQQACQANAGTDAASPDAPAVPQSEMFELRDELGPADSNRDQSVLTNQYASGLKDENKLTDAIFYDRHPEWKGKPLKNAGQALRVEWLQIRDGTVRPFLKHPPAARPTPAPATRPAPAPKPAQPQPAKTPATPNKDWLGYNTFENIRKYQPDQYKPALAAQEAFWKLAGFLPWYQKIMNAVPGVSIALNSHGIGHLVFSMDIRSFKEVVQSQELVNKAIETLGSATLGYLEFDVDFIGLLGLGMVLLEIAKGIENERMLGGTGPEAAKWRRDHALEFVIGLLAEDLSRHDSSGGFFINRNAHALASEIATRFVEFQAVYYKLGKFNELEHDLERFQGRIPDVIPPEPPVMRPYP